ncbi:DUF4198 domain-containing protein [Alkalilimnicola ehrlichii MLHE-1]|uniref:ABC-type Co2+ transport system periplasmic component-like protein n=1 Tax=Alkalilimnicola ehrlichii (strain ATCC BAA-1101 / DSM 17681 / MLHE-1) TaxID=187272 RepID=Q0A714_ALKEH|nr:DUF4198 domain-containing protein [Alkalilimnicola ehrlichii]ABI57373.1 ABC-type Co2+ transport system periplasmic component-like protein [Alkalilimnicola ehrlichii MLHE-1]
MTQEQPLPPQSGRHPLPIRGVMVSALLTALTLPALVQAHYPWADPTTHTPPGGQPLALEVGWGHTFPEDSRLSGTRLQDLVLWTPEAGQRAIPIDPGEQFQTPPLGPSGTGLIGIWQTPGYYSRTPQGGQRASRKEHPDALSCSRSVNSAKALLGSPPAEALIAVRLDMPLEIIPLQTPEAIAETGALKVRVLWQGEPYTGPVAAIHAETRGDVTDTPDAIADSDGDGYAKLTLDRPGRWLLHVHASTPYPTPNTCDVIQYNATLTLEVP